MARLSSRLLGALQVTLDGTPVTGFESDKERALLAFLAEESAYPHRREKLAGLLWPELTEPAARNNLRRALSNLRRLLGDRSESGTPFLLVTRQALQLNPAADVWTDGPAVSALLERPGRPTVAQLEEAIGLYRGDFLDGFSLADSPAFEEWAVLCRERYQRLVLEALRRLVEAIMPAIAQAAGWVLSPGREPRQQVLEYLGRNQWLLILDSLEHLLEGRGLVAEILRTAPEVKILVTSRVRLNLRGEHSLPLAGISCPERTPVDAQDAGAFAAVELFLLAARQVRPGYEPAAV